MEIVGSTAGNGAAAGSSPSAGTRAAVNAISVLSLHSWPDHGLSAISSVAAIVGFVAAIILLVSLALVYFTGTEMKQRIQMTSRPAGPVAFAGSPPAAQTNGNTAAEARAEKGKVDKLTKELTEARLFADSKKADLARTTTELDRIQQSEKAKGERVAKLESDFETVRRLEEEKSSRVRQLEEQLQSFRDADTQKTARLSQLQKDLESAKKSPSEMTVAEGPPPTTARRTLGVAQRETFLQAVRGHATGKVIVSAFFENKETHDFGASVINLLKEAGFTVVEQAPANFFTTSRPSSGIRIGCEDMTHPPPHFLTLRKAFEAMGMEIPDASIVNADGNDIVEVQITPKE